MNSIKICFFRVKVSTHSYSSPPTFIWQNIHLCPDYLFVYPSLNWLKGIGSFHLRWSQTIVEHLNAFYIDHCKHYCKKNRILTLNTFSYFIRPYFIFRNPLCVASDSDFQNSYHNQIILCWKILPISDLECWKFWKW